ncbi:hypothetical protein AK82_08430 [Streptococcus pneumoniae K2521]|nr:hypothetical protein AK82_08430 [Streptococcus pneumoniae K2521]
MLAGVGMSVAMGNGSSSVKEAAKHITTSNQQDGIHKALEHFVFCLQKKSLSAVTIISIRSRPSNHMMDERTKKNLELGILEGATHRAGFKIEEFGGVCSSSQSF